MSKFTEYDMRLAFNAGTNWKEKYSKDVVMPGLLTSDGKEGGTMPQPDFEKFMDKNYIV